MNKFNVWMMPVTPMTPRKLGYYDMSLVIDTYNNNHKCLNCRANIDLKNQMVISDKIVAPIVDNTLDNLLNLFGCFQIEQSMAKSPYQQLNILCKYNYF